jgi:hypothetical protein
MVRSSTARSIKLRLAESRPARSRGWVQVQANKFLFKFGEHRAGLMVGAALDDDDWLAFELWRQGHESAFFDEFGRMGMGMPFEPGLDIFNYLSTSWQFDLLEPFCGAVTSLFRDFVFQIGNPLLQLL